MGKILLFSFISLLFIGCGSGGENAQGSTASGPMSIGESYVMYQGDSVKKMSDDATLQIIHTNEKEYSNIILISGEAQITRK